MKIFFLIIILSLFYFNNSYAKDIEILNNIPGYGLEIKNHFKVHVNYRGTLVDGTEFDNSFKRNKPFVFQIGLRQVIMGWEKGLIGMKVGGKRTIKIPPNLAYGSSGAGNLIPPNATLIFELEIVDAFKPGYFSISSSEMLKMQKKNLILIDIRGKKEREKTGIIEGSIGISAFNYQGKLNKNFLKKYQQIVSKDDSVVLISDIGDVSSILANGFVENLGAKNMHTLVGGIQGWIKDKRKLKKNFNTP